MTKGLRSYLALLACLMISACSVSVPRDGVTAGSSQQVQGSTGGGASTGDALTPAGGDTATGTDVSGSDGPGTAVASGAGEQGAPGGSAGQAGAGAPAPSEQATVGVTKDTITISVLAGFSGNFGAIFTKLYENGFLVWADDVNANGGIHGRKVVVRKVDNRDTTEGGVDACKQIQNNGSLLAVNILGFGGADTAAAGCLDRAGITFIGFNLSSFSPDWRHVYSAGDPAKQTAPMASFIKNVIKSTEPVGIIYVNDAQYKRMRDPVVDELGKLGIEVVREEVVSLNQGSFVAELSRVRDAGAETVVLLVTSNEVVGILRDAKAIRYEPDWTGNYWSHDEFTTPGLMQGIKVIRNYATVDSPAYPGYLAKARKYGRSDVLSATTMALYGMGLFTGQVLQNAGQSPTRAGLGPAIESITNYNNQITMTLSFGPGVRIADVGMYPIECCSDENKWFSIGNPRVRF